MPKGVKCKKTVLKERMRALAQKSNDKQGRGVFSRLPIDIPEEFTCYGESRGKNGQTMVSVDSPQGSFRSFREAIEAKEKAAVDNLNISRDSGVNGSFDGSFYVPPEDPSSDELSESDEGGEEFDEDVQEEEGGLIPQGYFITENSIVTEFVAELNETSMCRTPNCQGKYFVFVNIKKA